ncbi:MAG: HD domain-containing protein [Synergistetes bacterium]|nr:HD domain-containing protein [Synergistota bacterium]MDW8192011.1 HD domain-containing protein [Synergistota bacterium]
MKRVYVDELKPGDKLAWPVYLSSGEILLEAGKVLSAEDIDKLCEWKVVEVFVEGYDEVERELEQERILVRVFREAHRNAVEYSKNIWERFSRNVEVKREEIGRLVIDAVENLSINRDVLLIISTYLKGKDEHLFPHAVNSMTISLAIASYLGYTKEELELIGVGALLHDIGLVKLYYETDGKFNEADIKHPDIGFKVVKSLVPGFHPVIGNIILQHHEKKDGSGFPYGLKGEEISREAMIVAVAELFERLTSPLSSDRRLSPFEAMKYILSNTKEAFDPKVVEALMRVMVIYPLGSLVRLNTGEIGRIAASTHNPFRPKVNIIFDKYGKPLEKVIRLNLAEESAHRYFIAEVLDESKYDLNLEQELMLEE